MEILLHTCCDGANCGHCVAHFWGEEDGFYICNQFARELESDEMECALRCEECLASYGSGATPEAQPCSP